MESAELEVDLPVVDSRGEDFVCDVSGVLPVVGERSLRNFHRGSAVRVGGRSQRSIADRGEIELEGRMLAQ